VGEYCVHINTKNLYTREFTNERVSVEIYAIYIVLESLSVVPQHVAGALNLHGSFPGH